MPFLWFLARKNSAGGQHLAGIFVLGGLQGVLGWYMVQAGSSTIRVFRLGDRASSRSYLAAML